MSMNNDQLEFLEFALPVIKDSLDSLSSWEQGFMSDQIARFEKYGADTHFSPKQWEVIERVWNKLDYTLPVGVKTRG